MKKKYYLLLVVAIAAVITFIVMKRNPQEQVMDTDNVEEGDDSIEHGPDLFCNYIDSKIYPQSKFISDMVELFNASVIYNGIKLVQDIWDRYDVPKEALEALKYADVNVLKSEDLKQLFSEALKLGKKALCKNYEEIDTIAFQRFNEQLDVIDSILANRYNVKNYVDLTDEDYWDRINRIREVPKTEDYPRTIHEVEDFGLKCAYAMEYVYDVGFYKVNFDILEDLLDDGRYSPLLYYLWRIWRCGVQLTETRYGSFGPSTWSQIPNKLYNTKRLAIARTTLDYIVKHPQDAIAMNQIAVIASTPNIYRRGEYMLGNQIFMEVFYLNLRPKTDEKNIDEEKQS